MNRPNTIISIREVSKPVLDEAAQTHQLKLVDLATIIITGFALLPENERVAMIKLGTQSYKLLEAGFKLSLEDGWIAPEGLEDYVTSEKP